MIFKRTSNTLLSMKRQSLIYKNRYVALHIYCHYVLLAPLTVNCIGVNIVIPFIMPGLINMHVSCYTIHLVKKEGLVCCAYEPGPMVWL